MFSLESIIQKNLLSKPDKKATRDGFGDAITELGKNNADVVVLTADLAESTRSHIFAKEFPTRFFEVGIAEQNMAGISAGLALYGKIPFMTSYAAFSPGRNWEQIRTAIAYSNANVKIISSHAGLSVGPDGATHQALEDIALTRVMPNMTVLYPSDYTETKKAITSAAEHEGPIYIRLARNKTPVIFTEKYEPKIGKADLISSGRDVTIVAAGPLLFEAIKAAKEMLEQYKVSCDIINCSTIKPLDEETILKSARKTRRVITVEDHQISGGLGGAVAELLSEKYPVPLKRIGMKDLFGESGDPSELYEKYEMNSNHIVMEIQKFSMETFKG